ncbi:TPR repeat-containing protein [Hymenobacter daecheongensis DSM 21074]|uniref:TPR repeat-containing protein n=1 Tax=Hymenobacter daecheongensis DSM 21074 TaxID=1121955 RepID=A0A1M6K4F8_9BACT|nr:tetratricopeptide repeat protein [Hymenobacter daecheongensis]SHJ53806.1 TPR repeat-containing protein [Hymenobacter daecheongensis DSM 21074]
MKLPRPALLFLPLAALLAACSGGTPTEQAARMVNLQTVQSGPHIQAQELDGAIRRQPGNAGLYARRAVFRLDAGQTAAALQDINRALELDDAPGEYYFTKARALRTQGRLQATLAAAQEASKNGFSSPELNLLVGETNLAAHNYQAALDHLDRTLQQEPDHAAALFYKGIAYVALADTAQALDYLRASLSRDPRQPEILHQLAFLSNAYRLPAEAATYSARGLRLAPTYGPLWYDHGRQFDLQNQPDSARRYYARAALLDSTLYRADYRLALHDYKLRRYATALPRLQRALRRNPRLPNARQMLAESFESLGRYPEAADQYRLLVAENPGNRHWTYKAWKTGTRARLTSSADTLRRAAPAPVELIPAARPVL